MASKDSTIIRDERKKDGSVQPRRLAESLERNQNPRGSQTSNQQQPRRESDN
jgi:hypothetical protein